MFDKETNLHYNWHRYYDPQLGSYIQSDPIGLDAGQFSTYTYVDGNPVSLVDPAGLAAPGGTSAGHVPKKPLNLPPINDPCVTKYIHDHYGDLGGFITEIGNTQQFMPSANPEFFSSAKEGLTIANEKLVITKGPGAIGNAIIKAYPAGLSIANVVGSGLAHLGGLASGVVEVAGAFMTPFATTAMALAREACTCQK